MLTLAEIAENQGKYGVSSLAISSETISYRHYLSDCRRGLTEKTPAEYYQWDVRTQTEFTSNLIVQFVRQTVRNVEGYVDENGEINQGALINRLKIDIIDAGILKDALADPEVQEIQINDAKSIWVVKRGKTELYCDENGNPYQFVSDEELHSTIYRLLYTPKSTPRMTEAEPLMNARTASKGFRVSGVYRSATTPDMKKGMDFPVTTFTIRKYAPVKFTFDSFIDSGMLTTNMAEFLKLCGMSDLNILFVGPVSSAKTTMLGTVLDYVPRERRLILIQNPTEIMKYERDPKTGTNTRNVLHWEAKDLTTDNINANTMENLISHSLRNTGTIIVPGEIRTAGEITQAHRAAKTGHRVLTSLHADGAEDAIARMASEEATLGGNQREHAVSLATTFNLVVTLRLLHDGHRRVMAIEECNGVNPDGSLNINKLYEFRYSGDTDYSEDGSIEFIHGEFVQVNPISETLQRKFFGAGISRSRLGKFMEVGDKPCRV